MRYLIIIILFCTGYNLLGQSNEVAFSEGTASYYANKYIGSRTASGETYQKDQLTAAHHSLPLNSKVKVTNLENGKSVVVRINDRMGKHSSRIIDLSHSAANTIGLDQRKGLVKVQLSVMN